MNNVINNEKTKKSIIIPIILCVILFVGAFLLGKYNKEVTKFLKSDKSSEVDNDIQLDGSNKNTEAVTLEETLKIINEKYSYEQFLNSQDSTIFDVQEFVKNYSNQKKLLNIYFKTNTYTKDLTKDLVEDIALELYGSKEYIKHENILCPDDGEALDIYNETTGVYTVNKAHGGHGTHFPPLIYNHLINFQYEDNKYVLTLNKIYIQSPYEADDRSNVPAYKSNSNYDLIQKALFTTEYNENVGFEEFEKRAINTFEKNYKNYSLPIYKYTFTKQDGKIKLLSYEIIR